MAGRADAGIGVIEVLALPPDDRDRLGQGIGGEVLLATRVIGTSVIRPMGSKPPTGS